MHHFPQPLWLGDYEGTWRMVLGFQRPHRVRVWDKACFIALTLLHFLPVESFLETSMAAMTALKSDNGCCDPCIQASSEQGIREKSRGSCVFDGFIKGHFAEISPAPGSCRL